MNPQLVRIDFVNPQLVRISFCESSARAHRFCASSARTHDFSDSSCVTVSIAFTVCALTKYTPPLLINGSCPSPTKPQERLVCEMCLYSMFAQVTYTQNRLLHVNHMEIVSLRLTTHCQPDLSLSVLLERFSVSTSELSRTIRLLQLGLPKHVDRGSAVDHHSIHPHVLRNHLGSRSRH